MIIVKTYLNWCILCCCFRRNCANNPQCLTGLEEEKYLKSQQTEIVALESSLSELRDPTEYIGLKNLGATCYVNSLIQMWFHNEGMRRAIHILYKIECLHINICMCITLS